MANKVTAHNTINTIRNDIIVSNKNLKNKFQALLDKMVCKMTLSTYTSDMAGVIKSCLKTLEQTLCRAQLAATAIAGSTAKVPEKSISFNLSAHKQSHNIDIDITAVRAELSSFNTIKDEYNQYISRLDGCKAQIASLPVENQDLNSVSVIESTFTGLYAGIFGGSNKAEVVKKAKQAFVNNVAEAVRIIRELISIIDQYTNNGSKLVTLLGEFESCETNVFNRFEQAFVKKYKDKTSAYNDSSVPEEGTLKKGIDEITAACNEWYAIRGQKCKDLEEEVTRLKNLYENHYGFEGRIKDLMNQEGFRDGENNPYNSNRPNYKGHVIPGASCYAIAAIFQYECTGQWAETNYVKINSINDIKAGDMLHYYGYNATGMFNGEPTGHWVFVYKVEDIDGVKKIYYAEGNAYDPDTKREGVNNYGVLDANSSGSMGTIRFSDVRRPNL